MIETVRNVRVHDRKGQEFEIDIDITIESAALARQLGQKAFNNVNRRSIMLYGLVEARMRGTKAAPVEKTYPQTEAFHAAFAKEP